MTYVYGAIIFISLSFNGFVQSYAYDAWKHNIPLRAMVAASGNTSTALELLTLAELTEVRT